MKMLNNRFTGSLVAIIVLFSTFLSSGCKKNKNPVETDVVFLGHRGSGNNGYNDVFMENTLSSAQNGISILDGVELDIQMSMDGTPWIFHDAEVSGLLCSGTLSANSIPLLADAEISQILLCHGSKKDRIYRLSEVISLFNSIADGFYLSLDIKTDFSASVFNQVGGKNNYLQKLAESLATTIDVTAPEKILLEIDNKAFCDKLRSYSNGKKFRFFFNRFEDMNEKIVHAKELGYNGLSCNFADDTVNGQSINKARSEGLSVQLWTPYYREDLIKTFGWSPDFIQTDNMNAKKGLNVK